MGFFDFIRVDSANKVVQDIGQFNWNVASTLPDGKERQQLIEKGWKRINAVIEDTPICGNAYLLRAHYQELFGKKQEALEDYNKAEQLEVSDAGDYFTLVQHRGRLKREMKDYAGAEEDFSAAIELREKTDVIISPSPSALHIQRGVLRRFMKKWSESEKDYEYAISHGNGGERKEGEHYLRLLKIEIELEKDKKKKKG